MPRAIRKSRSRCSNRSFCRKRHSLRDNLDLSCIREALYSAATNTRKKEPSERKKEKKPIDDNRSSVKPKSIIEHGIHYIMLPLHLIHICVWGSAHSAQTSSSSETKATSANNIRKQETKKSSLPIVNVRKNISSLTGRTSSSGSSFSSGFSSSSSVSSAKSFKSNPTEPPAASVIFSPSHLPVDLSISVPTCLKLAPVKPSTIQSLSSSARSDARLAEKKKLSQATASLRVLKEEAGPASDDSSDDEMVTAPEDFDDSSNDQWSNAQSSSFIMNMSVDLMDCSSGLEKLSSKLSSDYRLYNHEEPMDVSMEEMNFQANNKNYLIHKLPLRATYNNLIDERSREDCSSSSIEDLCSSDNNLSDSSIDREIARIFQRACTSSSSDEADDEDRHHRITNERSNDPFVHGSALITGIIGCRCACVSRQETSTDASVKRKQERVYSHNAHGSMKFQINKRSRHRDCLESCAGRLMDGRIGKEAKEGIGDFGEMNHQMDSAYSDEDVEMNFINESLSRLQSNPMSLRETVMEWMEQDLDYVADTEDSNDDGGSPLPLRSRINPVGIIGSGNFRNYDFGFVGCENRGRFNFNVDKIDENDRCMKFYENPDNQIEHLCRCGDPKCLFTSVALGVVEDDNGGVSLSNGNYPKAPSPLRHLYYEYPEFMTPPTLMPVNMDQSLPWIIIPCSVNSA